MRVEDIANQSSVVFEIGIQHDWKKQFPGSIFMFHQVVQKH